MITRVDSYVPCDVIDYLDIANLEENITYTKVCYVTDTKSGITKIGNGFFTFYVKDVNANIIPARLFSVEDYARLGFTANALKNKPVKIRFMAQKYNGSWSLIVESIDGWDGTFAYEKFIGKVECEPLTLSAFLKLTYGDDSNTINPVISGYRMSSLSSICGGRIGGFLLLAEHAASNLLNYCNFNSVNKDELINIFVIAIDSYFSYLTKVEEANIVSLNDVMSIVNIVFNKYKDTPYSDELIDTVRSLLGMGEPQHLYSHLITKTVQDLIATYDMLYMYDSMPYGAVKSFENRTLIKY